MLIATDVPLNPTQLRRLAKRGAIGIGQTGTSGRHYSGDLILAMSVANELYMPAIGESQPHSFHTEWLNDAYLDDVYRATVEAIDESVLNALVAADSVPTIKPPGQLLKAINYEALREVMRRYGKLVTA